MSSQNQKCSNVKLGEPVSHNLATHDIISVLVYTVHTSKRKPGLRKGWQQHDQYITMTDVLFLQVSFEVSVKLEECPKTDANKQKR